MSTVSDALKKAKRVEFLVELDFGGLVKRYAMRDLVVPYSTGTAKRFEAAILQPLTIGAKFDFRSMSYASQGVTIDIANKGRLQDEETRCKLDGGTGRIYVWAPGLDWSDIETAGLIYIGIFEKIHHTRSTYRFALRDFSESRFRQIPEQTITTDTWGNNIRTEGGAGSVAGMPQPILFGTWTKGIPLRCVDTVNFYYQLMAGKSTATEAEYNAGTHTVYDKDGSSVGAANYTFYPAAMDRKGNVAAYFDFVADQAASEPLSCGGYGVYDGSGEITGTAGNLIEHPSDIAYHLMRHHSLLALDEIHAESLKTMRSLLPGLKFATLINSQASGSDILDRLFRQCSAARAVIAGKVGAVVLATSSPALKALSWDRHLVGDHAAFLKTPMDEVVNKVRTRYALNPTTGQYEEELRRDSTNNPDCELSYYDYGEQAEYAFDLPDVQEEATAIALTNRVIELKSGRHDLIEIEVPYWDGIDLREGDAAVLSLRDGPSADGAGWSDETCILVERQFQPHMIKQRWWRVGA